MLVGKVVLNVATLGHHKELKKTDFMDSSVEENDYRVLFNKLGR